MKRALIDDVEALRLSADRRILESRRSTLGQFMTPAPVAHLMASMLDGGTDHIRILDPGAGVGCLSAAFVEQQLSRDSPPTSIFIEAYEVDETLLPCLEQTLEMCRSTCGESGVRLSYRIRVEDYIIDRASAQGSLLSEEANDFDCVIMNPPYGKLSRSSYQSGLLTRAGIDTTNKYSAFMLLAAAQLRVGGEFVSITPRSFCNGTYFRSFRRDFFRLVSPRLFQLFESRSDLFKGNGVLQENVVLYGVARAAAAPVTVALARRDGVVSQEQRGYAEVFWPGDSDMVVHLIADSQDEAVVRAAQSLTSHLDDLGVSVSTGRVVDFRARDFLRNDLEADGVPLIFPAHLRDGRVRWPEPSGRKPNAIVDSEETAELLVPNGRYVLVKRFSAKEERRRIVAAVFDPADFSVHRIGFDNKLNYFHIGGGGLPERLARGIAVFLNSSLADRYFRLFSGHTQVNAGDLRRLPFPSKAQLESLSDKCDQVADQAKADAAIAEMLAAVR